MTQKEIISEVKQSIYQDVIILACKLLIGWAALNIGIELLMDLMIWWKS